MASTPPGSTGLLYCLILVSTLLHNSQGDEYGLGGCGGDPKRCYKSVGYTTTTTTQVKRSYAQKYSTRCWDVWEWFSCTKYRTLYKYEYVYKTITAYKYQCRDCNIDCRVSQWSQWQCTGTCCATITEERTRTVTVNKFGNGANCPSLKETRIVYDDNRACYIDRTCYKNLQLFTNGCKKCNKDISRTAWELLSTVNCNDNVQCTKNDQCINGECKGTAYTCETCQVCDGTGCPTRIGQCYIQGKCYKLNDPNPDSPQCQVCNPSLESNWKFYTKTGTACDDKYICTKGDKCSGDGLCVGTPFTCLPDCQVCDGNNGCKTTSGCVVSGKCGCSIGGQCHQHGATNPSNVCQKCDIYSNANGWVNVDDGAVCNDANQCTRRDKCRSGTCGGDPFTCSADQPCIESSVCNGDGCTIVYRPTSYRCYTRQDACDWPDQYCTGIATCPQNSLKPISGVNIALGTVSVLQYGITASTALPYTAAESGTFYLMMTQNKGVRAKFSNFKVPCDRVTFSWQLVSEDASGAQKSITGTLTAGSDGAGTTEVSAGNLNLNNGGRFRVLVTARNVRSDSQKTQSQLILVDTTPPTFSGTIKDGDTKVDVQYQTSTTTLSAYWDPNDWSDLESGRDTASFQIAVGLQAYQTNVVGFVAAKPNEGVINNLKLQHNTRYYLTVSLSNRAGLRGQAASNGVLVDTTPPVPGSVTVQDDKGQVLQYLAVCSRQIRASIVDFKDGESGLDSFQWQLCKTPQSSPLQISCSQQSYVDFTCSPDSNCKLDVYHPEDRMVENGCFTNGYRYQLYIRARNRAGSFIDQLSNKFLVDLEPPIAGVVTDGLTADIDYQSDNQNLHATWTEFRDLVSGIDFCQLAAFEEYGTTSEKKMVDYLKVLASGQWTSDNLNLVTGKTYYINVKCYDKAGLVTEAASDGVMIDPLPPVPGQILDTDNRGLLEDVDYQVSTSEVKTKWEVFKSASGIKTCQWALSSSTSTQSVGDVAPARTVPLTGRAYNLSLQLTPYVKYYASVQCTSNAGLASVIAFSDGITADNTDPIAGTVFDLCNDGCGSVDDIAYSADTTALLFRWTGFSDPHSGVVEYDWNYATCGNNYYVMAQFLSAGLNTRVLKTGLVLNHNIRYCVTVRAINAAGAKSSATSDGILVDGTAPKGGILHDGSSKTKDVDYQSNNRILSYIWDLFVDPESIVNNLTIRVGSLPGLADVSPVRVLSTTATSYTVGALLLKHNHVYYGTVCATNRARVETCVQSDGVLIDASPPDIGLVVDGVLQPDIDYQANDHTIVAHWYGFKDVESNIERFQWGIGTSPNGTHVSPFTEVGTNVTAKKTGLKLINGKRYYVTVNAFNPGGHKVTKESDGVIVDITPPEDPDPAEPKIRVVGTSILTASWKNFTDLESPIWFYKWAVGTTRCGTQIQAHTNVGRATEARLTGAKFISGSTLYVSVMARNRADLTTQVCSSGRLFDVTPPKSGKVRDGLKRVDIQYLTVTNSIAANWDAFSDPDSGIATCYFGVGTSRSKTDVSDFVESGKATSFTQTGMTLQQGVTYYVHVKCTNGLGLNTTETSDGAVVDLTAPVNGSVTTVRYQVSLSEIQANWNGFVDADTGIESYSWAIGSQSASSVNIQQFVDIGPRQSGRATYLSLTPNQTYYVSLRAFNKAGLYTTRYSNGLTVDNSPPIAGVIQDGQDSNDIDWLTVTKGIGAKWSGFNDPHSTIYYYTWAVGTNPKGSQVMDYMRVENTEVNCSSCVFTSGSHYFVTVVAVNGVGLKTTTSSDGFVVDMTPPEIGYVSCVSWRKNNLLAVGWSGGSDAESGPLQCWVVVDGIRRHSVSDSSSQTILVNTSRLQLGNLINCSVQCVNKAGLSSTTNALLVDATPPGPGMVSIIDVKERTFTISWMGFDEQETYIAYYEWSVTPCLTHTHTFSHVTQSVDFRTSYTVAKDSNETCYDVRFRAVNSLGLTSNVAFIAVHLPRVEKPPEEACCDIDVKYTRNQIEATWSWKPGFHRFSSNARYRWSVGTISGRLQIMQYTKTGATPKGICSNCSVIQGATYYVTVQASVDRFETFVTSQSAAILIDFTKPERGTVQDGSSTYDVDYFPVTDSYGLLWGSFSDPESGIGNCTVTVLDDKSTELWRQTFASSTGSGTVSDITVPWKQGQRCRSVVVCHNGVGLSSQVDSDGFTVDGTPPTIGVTSLNIRSSSTGEAQITGSWMAYYDSESGIEHYAWSLYNKTGMQHVTEFQNVGGTNKLERRMTLISGVEYQLIVRSRNGAGLESMGFSPGVVYDITPPSPSFVYDGSGTTDIDYQSATQGIKGYWGSMEDNQTGIVRYEWAIGTEIGGEQIRPFEATGLNTEGSCPACLLSSGATYYVTVMAVNAAGLTTVTSSDGIIVDSTPPSPGTVFDGIMLQRDIRFQTSTTSLRCNWKNFTDGESHISMYKVCFSSDRENCDITAPKETDVTGQVSTAGNLHLNHSSTYYALVTAINRAGLSVTTASDGVIVDTTPPVPGFVSEGERKDIDCIWSNESLHVHWGLFYDYESDIASYEFAVGSAPGSHDVLPFMSVNLDTAATCNPTWSVGQTIYVTVRAYNEAGGQDTKSSDGVKVLSPDTDGLKPEDCVSLNADLLFIP